jgi:hypothetical protein
MNSCWSCLVVLEQGAQICPLCGADQAHPIELSTSDPTEPVSLRSPVRDWRIALGIVIASIAIMAGIYWSAFGARSISPDMQAAQVTAKSLRSIREELSAYALFAKDTYPSSLDNLMEHATLPTQAAMSAGYKLQYDPKLPANDGAFRGYVIVARPQKNGYPNLYIDETGVVRVSAGNQTATRLDPPL